MNFKFVTILTGKWMWFLKFCRCTSTPITPWQGTRGASEWGRQTSSHQSVPWGVCSNKQCQEDHSTMQRDMQRPERPAETKKSSRDQGDEKDQETKGNLASEIREVSWDQQRPCMQRDQGDHWRPGRPKRPAETRETIRDQGDQQRPGRPLEACRDQGNQQRSGRPCSSQTTCIATKFIIGHNVLVGRLTRVHQYMHFR